MSLCDGKFDCDDASDESPNVCLSHDSKTSLVIADITSHKCPSASHYICPDQTYCAKASEYCHGKPLCFNGSDLVTYCAASKESLPCHNFGLKNCPLSDKSLFKNNQCFISFSEQIYEQTFKCLNRRDYSEAEIRALKIAKAQSITQRKTSFHSFLTHNNSHIFCKHTGGEKAWKKDCEQLTLINCLNKDGQQLNTTGFDVCQDFAFMNASGYPQNKVNGFIQLVTQPASFPE